MRRDGREFPNGGEAARRFSEVSAERPQLERYIPPAQLAPGEVRAIDNVPPLDELVAPPTLANVGHAATKRRL